MFSIKTNMIQSIIKQDYENNLFPDNLPVPGSPDHHCSPRDRFSRRDPDKKGDEPGTGNCFVENAVFFRHNRGMRICLNL